MAHDVFVSYSSKDKAIADSIVAALESNQIRCWYTPRDIKPGEDWGEAITNAIEDCRVFLVIFSSNANRSQRVLDEVNLAIDTEAVLLPFRIENLTPKGAMKLHLSSRHWLDAFDPSWQSHLEQLIQEVSANLDTKIKKKDIRVPQTLFNGKEKSKSRIWIPVSLIFGALLLAAGWFGYPLLKPEDDTPTPQAETAVAASPTARPTETQKEDTSVETVEVVEEPALTPVPGWAEAAAEPIWTAIQNNEPYFEDDFSQPEDGWQFESWLLHSNVACSATTEASIGVSEGILRTVITTDCPQISAHNQKMEKFENHALQVDINFKGASNSGVFIEKGFMRGDNLSFVIESWGSGRLEQCVPTGGDQDCTDNNQKRISFDNSQPIRVTFIHTPPEAFVYLDSVLVFARNDLKTDLGPGNLWFSIFSERVPGELTVELDNLMVWDLDMFEY